MRTTVRRRTRLVAVTSALAVLAFLQLGQPVAPASATDEEEGTTGDQGRLLLVLDASGSMKEPAGGGQTRFQAAKGALRQVIGALPEETQAGLRIYGQNISDGPGSCEDTELVVPVDDGNRAELRQAVRRARPLGNTPIARSLEQAMSDLPEDGQRSVVLISDGEETCGGDPCQVARDLSEQGVDLRVDVVGFQVGPQARDQLTCIAQAGRGTYHDAPDAASLVNQLERISARAARAYAPTGTPIEGADGVEGAPDIEAGQYLDTIGDGGQVETYRVEPAEGATLHVAATVRPTVAEAAASEALTLRVLSGESGDTECASFRESAVGAFDGLTPVTAAGMLPGEELAECGPGPYAVQVEREGGQGAQPLETIVIEEADVASTSDLPPAAEAGEHGAQPRVDGQPRPAVGAPAFDGAPVLEPGRYRDSVLLGETLMYAVELDWGEQVACRATFGADPAVERALGTRSPTAEVRAYGPTRGVLSDPSATTSGFYEGSSDVALGLATPPVRYLNRESGGDIATASIPGTYFCGVMVRGIGMEPSEVGEIPVELAVDVTGEAGEGAPEYVEDAEATPSAGPVGEQDEDAVQATGGDGGDGTSGLAWGIGAVVLVLLVAGAAWFLLRRSRRLGA